MDRQSRIYLKRVNYKTELDNLVLRVVSDIYACSGRYKFTQDDIKIVRDFTQRYHTFSQRAFLLLDADFKVVKRMGRELRLFLRMVNNRNKPPVIEKTPQATSKSVIVRRASQEDRRISHLTEYGKQVQARKESKELLEMATRVENLIMWSKD